MTRGEAPGGSRPGAFGAIRLRRMDGGIATAPLGGSAHPPSARPHRRRATEAGGQPPAPFMGLAGGCPRARDGENSASLIFLALPRSACPRFWAGLFSYIITPHMDGG
jgi:hypothetical protein